MGRRRLRGGLAVLALSPVLLGLGACGVPHDRSPQPLAVRDRRLTSPTVTQPVYFFRDGRLSDVAREVPLSSRPLDVLRSVLRALLEGPTASELGRGYSNTIGIAPEGVTSMRVTRLEGSTVFVDISDAVGVDQNGSALAQVVLTLTAVDGVRFVEFVEKGLRLPQVPDGNSEQTPTPVSPNAYDVLVRTDEVARLYFVSGDRLRPVDQTIERSSSDEDQVDAIQRYLVALDIGPQGDDQRGLSSVVSGLNPQIRTEEDPEGGLRFVLVLPSEFSALTRTRQALALGQILFTLNVAEPAQGIGALDVQVGGTRRTTVPGPGTAELRTPVAASAYRSLLAPPAAVMAPAGTTAR